MAKKKSKKEAEGVGHNSSAQLASFVSRLSNLTDDVAEAIDEYVAPIRADIKVVYAEAVAAGYDKNALKEALRRKRMDEELRALVDTYESALLNDLLS